MCAHLYTYMYTYVFIHSYSLICKGIGWIFVFFCSSLSFYVFSLPLFLSLYIYYISRATNIYIYI